MTFFALGLVSIALLFVLFLIDRNVRGGKSIITKVLSVIVIVPLVFGTIYFYGTTPLEVFDVDLRSFSKIKLFFTSRFFALIITAIFVLFVLVCTIYVTILVFNSKKPVEHKEEGVLHILKVSYDIDVIPDNSVLSDEKFNFKEGLEATNLVFSFAFEG